MDYDISISKLFNRKEFQKVQDCMAHAINAAIITVDYKGIPFTTHSNCSKFCSLVRQNAYANNYCQKCDSRGGLESARLNAPYMYLCHYNIIDVAIPITVDENYIGAVMIGQVQLSNIPKEHVLEQIIPSTQYNASLFNFPQYSHAFADITSLNYSDFMNYTSLIYETITYMVRESVEKLKYKQIYLKDSDSRILHKPSLNLQAKTNSVVIEPDTFPAPPILSPPFDTSTSGSELLQPLLSYMEVHPNKFLSAHQAAQLCGVSSSYFSKMFKQTMNISYVNYVNEHKIAWAKEFLRLSNKSIDKISEKLGFNNTSYFIKTFKQHENLTPKLYRKYYKEF